MKIQLENKLKKQKCDLFEFAIKLSIISLVAFPLFKEYGKFFTDFCIGFSIIIGIIIKGKEIKVTKYLIGYALYIAFSFVSLIWCLKIGEGYLRIKDMILALLWGVSLCTYCCSDKKKIKNLLSVFSYSVLFISLYCVIVDFNNLLIWPRLGLKQFESAGQNQIYYSCILIYSTCFFIYDYIICKKFFLLNFAIILYLCCLLTGIRKCMIFPLLFLFFIIIILNKKSLLKITSSIICVVIIVFFLYKIVPFFSTSMVFRIESLIQDITTDAKADATGNSYTQRLWLSERAKEIYIENWIGGVGVGQFKVVVANEGVSLYSHNNYLEILANTGTIGFLLYYGNLLLLFRKVIRSKNYDKNEKINMFFMSFLCMVLIMEYWQVDYYQLFNMFFLVLASSISKKNHVFLP